MRLRVLTACALGLMCLLAATADDKEKKGDEIVIEITGKGGKSQYIRKGDAAPQDVTVVVGQTVKWVNLSTAPHTATSDKKVGDKFLFGTKELNKDDSDSVKFDEQKYKDAGGKNGEPVDLPYHCEVHPAMHGKLVLKPAADAKKEGKK